MSRVTRAMKSRQPSNKHALRFPPTFPVAVPEPEPPKRRQPEALRLANERRRAEAAARKQAEP